MHYALYPVSVRRPAALGSASFRPHLAMKPLPFPYPSALRSLVIGLSPMQLRVMLGTHVRIQPRRWASAGMIGWASRCLRAHQFDLKLAPYSARIALERCKRWGVLASRLKAGDCAFGSAHALRDGILGKTSARACLEHLTGHLIF